MFKILTGGLLPYIAGFFALASVGLGIWHVVRGYQLSAVEAERDSANQRAATATKALETFKFKDEADKEFVRLMNESFLRLKAATEDAQRAQTDYNEAIRKNANSNRPLDPAERAALRRLFGPSQAGPGAAGGLPGPGPTAAPPKLR